MESHAHAHAHGDCCGGSVWWTRAFTVFAGLVLYNTAKGWWYKISSYAPKLEEFDNKVLWITGASSGIGKELASQLALQASKRGTKIKLILSSRSRETLESVKKQLSESIPADDIAIVPLDLDKTESLEVDFAFECFGRIDILVNNAGISQRSLARHTDVSVSERLSRIDYIGQVALAQKYVSKLIETGKKGHIVNVSSVAGKLPVPFRSSYCAAKAALNAYSNVLRLELELEKLPISVSTISPGGVATDVSRNALDCNGKSFGEADEVTKTGMAVEECVAEMLTAISNKIDDVCICSNRENLAVKLFGLLPLKAATMVMKPQYRKYLNSTLDQVKKKSK